MRKDLLVNKLITELTEKCKDVKNTDKLVRYRENE